jgi:gliding motility-associated-like protein
MKKYLLYITVILSSIQVGAQSTLLESPILTCVHNLTASNTDIELLWNVPPVLANFQQYEIYTATQRNGPYNLVQTISNPAQNSATLNVGDNSAIYYVYMQTRRTVNNPAPLTPQSDTLDNNPNQKPPVIIDFVSVNVDYSVTLDWVASPYKEVIGYIIFLPGGATDTVFGRLNTEYTDYASSASSKPNNYQIRTFEYCENYPDPKGRNGDISAPATTIFAKAPFVDKCTQSATIEWTSYFAPNTTVLGYGAKVARGLDLIFENEYSVPSDSFSIVVEDIPDGEIVCIRVYAALSNGDTSYANMQCIVGDVYTSPEYHAISNITVLGDNVFITYHIDTLADIMGYDVERSSDSITFTKLTSGVSRIGDKYQLIFTDFSAKPSQEYYYYRIVALDSCNNPYYTNIGNTIFLEGEDEALDANISWNYFYLEDAKNIKINIYEIKFGDTIFIKTLNSSTTTHTQKNVFELDTLFEVCFYIEAVYNYTLPSGITIKDSSYSNEICIKPTPKIFAPNAFNPSSVNKINRVFIPNFVFYTPKNYTLTIYDRWYREVFTTDNYKLGWDGIYKGEIAPNDSYIYYLRFEDGNNNTIEKKGSFLLLR